MKATRTEPGERYGRWTVLSEAPPRIYPSGTRARVWNVACDCGNVATALQGNLRSGASRSCGCLRDELTVARSSTQGGLTAVGRQHPLFRTWNNMLNRCYAPSSAFYADYGDRGITVCDRWRGRGGLQRFIEDMGPRPADPEGWASVMPYWTLDRVDVNGNYEPSNCRWATPSQQARNQRRKTHCKHGHPLSGDNLYTHPNRPGEHMCRTCRRVNAATWRARQAARGASEH